MYGSDLSYFILTCINSMKIIVYCCSTEPEQIPTPTFATKMVFSSKVTKALITKSMLNTTAEMGENLVLWCTYKGTPPMSIR